MDLQENPADTTGRLIAASKVSGTDVFNRAGDKLGSIYDVMLDKASGASQYAVLSFGGFLGIGEKYHPLPWHALTYDPQQGGYVVDLDRKMLENAPSYDNRDSATWGDSGWGSKVDDYYGKPNHNDLRLGGNDPVIGAAPLI